MYLCKKIPNQQIVDAKAALGKKIVFNFTKKSITKYINFSNKNDLVRISNTDKSAFFIYNFFNMLESMTYYQDKMTITRTNNIENFEDYYPN